MRVLITIPVFNEQAHVLDVLARVQEHALDVLVVDDGSTDLTPMLLAQTGVDVIRHGSNRGYGRSLIDAFHWASLGRYDWVITMDCDEQHEPERIGDFLQAIEADNADMISGSRYLAPEAESIGSPPPDRRRINRFLTEQINQRLGSALGTRLTDAFCGFKGHRVEALRELQLTEHGYAFPMQLWPQTAARRHRVVEIPVTLIYNDPNRSFGQRLDDPSARLRHYVGVLNREIEAQADALPVEAHRACMSQCQSTVGQAQPASRVRSAELDTVRAHRVAGADHCRCHRP